MKRILFSFRSMSLRARISLLVAAVFLLVLFVCQATLYDYVAESRNRQASSTARVMLKQVQTYMDAKLRSVKERLLYIQLDTGFEEALAGYLLNDREAEEGVVMTRLSRCLSLHKATEPLVSSLFLYTPKSCFTDMSVSTVKGYCFEGSPLWRQRKQSTDYFVWGELQRDEIFITRREVLPIMYQFRVNGYGESCVLLANIDRLRLTEYLSNFVFEEASQLCLVDTEGKLVTKTDGAVEELPFGDKAEDFRFAGREERLTEVEYKGEKYLLAYCMLANAPWRVVYLQSKAPMLKQLENIRRVFWIVSLCAVLVILLALSRIVHSVTRPLMQLSEKMRHMGEQERLSMESFEYPYRNEIGSLAQSFNSMLIQISVLLDRQEKYIEQLKNEKERVYMEQRLKRKAELKALQAQINPHFLYNTLDSIRWKAEIAGEQDISRMTTALATLFRIGLSRGKEIITVEQELRHVGSYLQIQELRYGEKLKYEIEAAQKIMQLCTIKLVLQPLVENAIYHGIKEKNGQGMIQIKGRCEGEELLLQVLDNGRGIPAEQLSLLRKRLLGEVIEAAEGYGIFNVNERIRLCFGAQYGLRIESEYGRGTTVTIRLPRMISEKEE